MISQLSKWWKAVIIIGSISIILLMSSTRQYTEPFSSYLPLSSSLKDIMRLNTSNVNLPINTTKDTCDNMCGPLARCALSGEQCLADSDCCGCDAKSQ